VSHESQIAAARAFLEAGNFKLAIKHAEEVLQKDPENSRALEVLGDTLLKTNEHQRLEELSVSWLGRDPSAGAPHMFLFFCYLQRKDEKMARALLDHFSTACPGHKREIDMFEAAFKTKFGKPEEGFDSLARIYAADGDKRSAFKFNSLAALKRQNLSEAITEGEFARRSGDVSPSHAIRRSWMAVASWRRLSRCRHRFWRLRRIPTGTSAMCSARSPILKGALAKACASRKSLLAPGELILRWALVYAGLTRYTLYPSSWRIAAGAYHNQPQASM